MLRTVRPRRLFIDGPNAAGKTTVAKIARRLLSGPTVIETHDFFHLHIIRLTEVPACRLVEHRAWRDMPYEAMQQASRYCRDRQDAILGLVELSCYDSIIAERVPITYFVYMNLLFGIDTREYLVKSAERIASAGGTLVFVMASLDDILARLAKANDERADRGVFPLPEHLVRRELIEKKIELYEVAYEIVRRFDHVRLDTTQLSAKEVEITMRAAWA